jgi:hypothetical protein
MTRFDYVRVQCPGPSYGVIEVFQLKPEEDTIAIGPQFRVPKWTVLVLDAPVMQLKDQLSVHDQPFILAPAVSALAVQEALIPAAARLDVMHANERL